jgi:hypothetical protein
MGHEQGRWHGRGWPQRLAHEDPPVARVLEAAMMALDSVCEGLELRDALINAECPVQALLVLVAATEWMMHGSTPWRATGAGGRRRRGPQPSPAQVCRLVPRQGGMAKVRDGDERGSENGERGICHTLKFPISGCE